MPPIGGCLSFAEIKCLLTEEQLLSAKQLKEPQLREDMLLISVPLLQGELLLPASRSKVGWPLPGANFSSGKDTDKTKPHKGPLLKHGLVLLPQRRLLPRSVHANWLLRELLQPKRELLFSLQRRKLKQKKPK